MSNRVQENDTHLKMVFCYQNCSDLLWEKIVLMIEKLLKFEAVGQEFSKKIWSFQQFIQTVKGQYDFLKKNVFF